MATSAQTDTAGILLGQRFLLHLWSRTVVGVGVGVVVLCWFILQSRKGRIQVIGDCKLLSVSVCKGGLDSD